MQRDIDQVEKLLIKWAEHMRSPEEMAASYPCKAPGFIGSWIKDFEELCECADGQEMARINASIESLIPPHMRIIHKRHNLSYMVWSFQNEDALYDAAKSAFKIIYFQKK